MNSIIRPAVVLFVVVVVVSRLDVVAGKEDAVGTRDLEVDALVLTDGDVQGLLEVLGGLLVGGNHVVR